MNLNFNKKLAEGYSSNSQIARILTENWVLTNSYCPSCGEIPLHEFENNRPVADFYCNTCKEEFELKSKSGKISKTVTDGAYSTMINRINSGNNPNFFFLTYSKDWSVSNFLIIPKQFFTDEIIVKRTPLSATARRAGWVGCNINISGISDTGKVFLVKNSVVTSRETVKEVFNKTLFLRTKNEEEKGWTLDIITCVDSIKKADFTLDEVYAFERSLSMKHPNNNFIKDKIRQQLQVLRDKNIIEFSGRGKYKKVNYGTV